MKNTRYRKLVLPKCRNDDTGQRNGDYLRLWMAAKEVYARDCPYI